MIIKLNELGEIYTGNTPSKSKSDFYDSEDICFVKPDIISDSEITIISSAKEYISEKARAKARIVNEDSIFVTCIGTIGKIGIAAKGDFAFNQQINAIKPNNKVIPKYLAYNLLFSKPRLVTIANAPVVPIINKSQFSEFTVKFEPEISLQRKIVETLDKVSSLISLRKQQLSKLDELVKARFVEMFGNPVSNDSGWKKVRLADCLNSIDSGKSFVCGSSARLDDWSAVLKLSAVTYGEYRPEENKAMLDESQFLESAEVNSGDLLFTRKNTPELVGMCAYVYSTPQKLMIPDLIFRLNTKPKCNKIYLWKLINHELFRDSIKAIATGTAKSMSNISKERLSSLKIILPPIELQEQFAAFVVQSDKSKLEIQTSLEKLETLKKALMQKYFG